jgi:hypothetical protein
MIWKNERCFVEAALIFCVLGRARRYFTQSSKQVLCKMHSPRIESRRQVGRKSKNYKVEGKNIYGVLESTIVK